MCMNFLVFDAFIKFLMTIYCHMVSKCANGTYIPKGLPPIVFNIFRLFDYTTHVNAYRFYENTQQVDNYTIIV